MIRELSQKNKGRGEEEEEEEGTLQSGYRETWRGEDGGQRKRIEPLTVEQSIGTRILIDLRTKGDMPLF